MSIIKRVSDFNTYHAGGEKCIQTSTNMLSIGLVICEAFDILKE